MLASSQCFGGPVFEVPETPPGTKGSSIPCSTAGPGEVAAWGQSQACTNMYKPSLHLHSTSSSSPGASAPFSSMSKMTTVVLLPPIISSSPRNLSYHPPLAASSSSPHYLCCLGDTHTAEPLAKSQEPFFPNIFFWTVRPSFNSGNDTARYYVRALRHKVVGVFD